MVMTCFQGALPSRRRRPPKIKRIFRSGGLLPGGRIDSGHRTLARWNAAHGWHRIGHFRYSSAMLCSGASYDSGTDSPSPSAPVHSGCEPAIRDDRSSQERSTGRRTSNRLPRPISLRAVTVPPKAVDDPLDDGQPEPGAGDLMV